MTTPAVPPGRAGTSQSHNLSGLEPRPGGLAAAFPPSPLAASPLTAMETSCVKQSLLSQSNIFTRFFFVQSEMLLWLWIHVLLIRVIITSCFPSSCVMRASSHQPPASSILTLLPLDFAFERGREIFDFSSSDYSYSFMGYPESLWRPGQRCWTRIPRPSPAREGANQNSERN